MDLQIQFSCLPYFPVHEYSWCILCTHGSPKNTFWTSSQVPLFSRRVPQPPSETLLRLGSKNSSDSRRLQVIRTPAPPHPIRLSQPNHPTQPHSRCAPFSCVKILTRPLLVYIHSPCVTSFLSAGASCSEPCEPCSEPCSVDVHWQCSQLARKSRWRCV